MFKWQNMLHSNILSLDNCINRAVFNIFGISDKDVVKTICYFDGLPELSVLMEQRHLKFVNKLLDSNQYARFFYWYSLIYLYLYWFVCLSYVSLMYMYVWFDFFLFYLAAAFYAKQTIYSISVAAKFLIPVNTKYIKNEKALTSLSSCMSCK